MEIGRRSMRHLGLAAVAGAVMTTPAIAQPALSTWVEIRNRGALRVGVTPSEPWYAKSPASGRWTGCGAYLAEQVAKDMNVGLEYVETTWSEAPAGLQAGHFDAMFILDPTPARALAIDFPFAPVLHYALGFLAREAEPAKTWAELDRPDVTIALPLSTSQDRWLSAHMHKASIVRLKTSNETLLYYQSGRANVLVLYHPALLAYRLKVGQGSVIVPKPTVISVACAGVRREADKTWRDYLTSVLTFYYENGTIEDFYRRYLAELGLDMRDVPGITRDSLNQR